MSEHARASFDVTGWDQEPYDDGSGTAGLSKATVRKSFRGDLQGESVAQLLMVQSDPSDLSAGAGYVASEVVRAALHGRTGTFVLQHWGLTGDGAPRTGGHVVPGTATGELAGLTGTVEIDVAPDGSHTLQLAFELP